MYFVFRGNSKLTCWFTRGSYTYIHMYILRNHYVVGDIFVRSRDNATNQAKGEGIQSHRGSILNCNHTQTIYGTGIFTYIYHKIP